eukprot:GFKZ01008805.1.p3 GENE.GFKZ01008805.1~~GFKZ01008805.1.p3  ORF type:complete len:133 (-),score=1.91 GFKZ01008805.1:308-706(-)
MSHRLLHLLAITRVTPEAGLTGIAVLTGVVWGVASGDLPDSKISLISSVTLLPMQSRPDKTRPIAIGTALRPLVTKVLLLQVFDDYRDYLVPTTVASGVPSGLDSFVPEVQRHVHIKSQDDGCRLLSVSACT